MRYLLLIYTSDETDRTASTVERECFLAGGRDRYRRLLATGMVQVGEPLEPTDTATTVRVRAGETLTADGPLTAGRVQLGGFLLIECADLDAAIDAAAGIPAAASGAVEVRPVRELEPTPPRS